MKKKDWQNTMIICVCVCDRNSEQRMLRGGKTTTKTKENPFIAFIQNHIALLQPDLSKKLKPNAI